MYAHIQSRKMTQRWMTSWVILYLLHCHVTTRKRLIYVPKRKSKSLIMKKNCYEINFFMLTWGLFMRCLVLDRLHELKSFLITYCPSSIRLNHSNILEFSPELMVDFNQTSTKIIFGWKKFSLFKEDHTPLSVRGDNDYSSQINWTLFKPFKNHWQNLTKPGAKLESQEKGIYVSQNKRIEQEMETSCLFIIGNGCSVRFVVHGHFVILLKNIQDRHTVGNVNSCICR